MFSTGFLGTTAPLYLDIITIYFALLPFLLFFSISYAIKKDFKKHYYSQVIVFAVTLIVVVYFEVGVRISGGIVEFMKSANISYIFMIPYLIVHVSIALVSVIVWAALIYGGIKNYILEKKDIPSSHAKFGRYVFLGMTISSFMGVGIYYFLFIQ